MINVATAGVDDHKAAKPKSGVSSSILSNKASPTAMHSTSTEKMAALLVSVSFVNISRTLPPAVSSAECSCLVVGSRSGSYPWSRRRAGSGLALLRSVHATRNYRILLLCEGIYVPQGTKLAEELPRTPTKQCCG